MSAPSVRSGFVAIVGRPNVGKSTLLNRILGSPISIVTPKAQTTRERIAGILTEPRGQIVFVDTPGLHSAKPGGINASMVEEAKRALDGVQLSWVLVDPSSHSQFEALVFESARASRCPFLVLLNKSDLKISPQAHERLEKELQPLLPADRENFLGFRRISGKTGEGIEELLQETWALLPEGPMYYPDPDQLSDRPMRFFVAEKIREQLYLCLGEELPYSCGVRILEFKESMKPVRIEAEIIVERESQKGMVIGKGGQKIKQIGSQARQNIEKLVGGQVFLGLEVKVWKDWTREPEMLRKLGYLLPDAK